MLPCAQLTLLKRQVQMDSHLDSTRLPGKLSKVILLGLPRTSSKKGKMLKEVNATLMSPVPKVNAFNSVKDFRPIACCIVSCKVITKILANRIQEVLDGLICFNQGSFIRGRSIMDNVLVCQEIL